MDYEQNVKELTSRMERNLQDAKNKINQHLPDHVHMVSGVLEMLDGTYFQGENGVNDISFAGKSTAISNNEITIFPCVFEPNATIHSFNMRSGCFITGYLSLIYNGKAYTMFNIKPYQIDTLNISEIKLIATSNCDDCPNFVEILVKLDSKKRISRIQITNIKFSDFPNVRSEFLNALRGHMDMIHIDDVRILSNSLALKYAINNISKNSYDSTNLKNE